MNSQKVFEYLFSEYNDFRGVPLIDVLTDYTYYFYAAAILYLIMVHGGPYLIKKPMKLKPWFIAWNLLLAVFSTLGAIYSLPRALDMYFGGLSEPGPHNPLYKNGQHPSLHFAMCVWDHEVFFDNRVGVWLLLFTLSKIPEMIDTLFLVLQKKKVIFLHWFHHATVMLYCWHCYTSITPAGFTFAAMNYTVHSIMYSYYFVCACGYRHLVRRFAWLITGIQIAQMIIGLVIESYLCYQVFISGAPCTADRNNVRFGFAMYFSYLILFSQLYYNSYIKKAPHPAASAAQVASGAVGPSPTPIPAQKKKN